MSVKMYFDKESPDFNYGIWGRYERLSANRCIICLMTEYGLNNDRRMYSHQVNLAIENIQPIVIIRE